MCKWWMPGTPLQFFKYMETRPILKIYYWTSPLSPPLPSFLLLPQVDQILQWGTDKEISLEIGGNSPFVVYDMADLDAAVEDVVDAIFFNQGQVWGRLSVVRGWENGLCMR